jgi:hypothetical protein
MRSAVAHALSQEQRERLAAMTPAERVALAVRLGEEGIASYMATHASIGRPPSPASGPRAASAAGPRPRRTPMTIEPVTRVLDAADVSYALIGAHAMTVRGYPRIGPASSQKSRLASVTWGPTCDRSGAIF